MWRVKYKLVGLLMLIIAGGCANSDNDNTGSYDISSITEQADGTIILNLKEAYMLQDSLHPDMNTAEWLVNIKNRGRYELWLSSLTKDTMDLQYDAPVIINLCDKSIRAHPIGNKIVLDAPDAGDIYFRADSRLGSVYVDKPGSYNIQVVSSKVRHVQQAESMSNSQHTQLRSLILKPMTE
ncbi:MAG: hypothetical protein KFF49_09710 [Bacteroidales bacterium]|nr:hypothetical protein [Bacteroidales bacterium]